MRYVLAAVGRARKSPEQDLFELYRRRLSSPLDLKEVEEKRPLPVAARMEREAALLQAQIPAGAAIVVLDEAGAAMSSTGFAAWLKGCRDRGLGAIAFLVGGADGHHDTVRRRADLLLSLSAMTWPHMLVRVLLAEQIYRAESILANHPYHRGTPPA